MQPPGARPAVGAGEYRGIAKGGFHPRQFARRQRQSSVPIDRNERLRAAARAIALCAVFEKSLPDMRTVDAALVVDGPDQRLRQRRRMFVLLKRLDANNPPIADIGPKGPPMGCSSDQTIVHCSGALARSLLRLYGVLHEACRTCAVCVSRV